MSQPKQNSQLVTHKLYPHNFLQQYRTPCACTVGISPTNSREKHRHPVLQDKTKASTRGWYLNSWSTKVTGQLAQEWPWISFTCLCISCGVQIQRRVRVREPHAGRRFQEEQIGRCSHREAKQTGNKSATSGTSIAESIFMSNWAQEHAPLFQELGLR